MPRRSSIFDQKSIYHESFSPKQGRDSGWVQGIDSVDGAVDFLVHRRAQPTRKLNIYSIESRGDIITFTLEGFHNAELREIHDRVTGQRRRNPGRRDTNVYHPAPDDTQLRRDGTPFPHHCKHGIAPPRGCHTCHPRSDCEICAEFRENPLKGWRGTVRTPRDPSRNPDEFGWRQRGRMMDGFAMDAIELRETSAGDDEWRELEKRVKNSELDPRDKEYVLSQIKRAWDETIIDRDRRHRQRDRLRGQVNPGRFVNRPPRENPGLHTAIERAAKSAAMTGTQPRSGEVADWIRQYPKTWRQMVARYSR